MQTVNQPNKTTQIVREAMRIVSREVRAPRVVREGIVQRPPVKVKSNK